MQASLREGNAHAAINGGEHRRPAGCEGAAGHPCTPTRIDSQGLITNIMLRSDPRRQSRELSLGRSTPALLPYGFWAPGSCSSRTFCSMIPIFFVFGSSA